MKKAILFAVLALALLVSGVPSAYASSVAIDPVSFKGCGSVQFFATGSSVYDGGDTATLVYLDGSYIATTGAAGWSVEMGAGVGTHTITATVGSASATQTFVVGACGGGDPMNAPCWSELGSQSCGQKLALGWIKFVPKGMGACEAWFPIGCLEIVKNPVKKTVFLKNGEGDCDFFWGCTKEE